MKHKVCWSYDLPAFYLTNLSLPESLTCANFLLSVDKLILLVRIKGLILRKRNEVGCHISKSDVQTRFHWVREMEKAQKLSTKHNDRREDKEQWKNVSLYYAS